MKGGHLDGAPSRRPAAAVLAAAFSPHPAARSYRQRWRNGPAHPFRDAVVHQLPVRRHARRRPSRRRRRLSWQQHPNLEKVDRKRSAEHGDAGRAQETGGALRPAAAAAAAERPISRSASPPPPGLRVEYGAVADGGGEGRDAREGGPLGEPPPGRADRRRRELSRAGGQHEKVAEDARDEASSPSLGRDGGGETGEGKDGRRKRVRGSGYV